MHLVHGGNSFNDDVTFVQDHVLDQGVHDLMHLVHEVLSVHGDVTFTQNHVLDHGYQDLVHLVGNSCYLSAALRRRGRFFSPIGSGPRGSGLWNGDRDKHWEQLLIISGPSSPGAVFFSY